MNMINMIVRQSQLRGQLSAPPSKSYTHRAIICAALADGVSTIHDPLLSEDIEATLRACEALGAKIIKKGRGKIIIGGCGGAVSAKETLIDCSESGSTLRFMIPLAALSDKEIILTGKEGLRKRPVGDLLDALGQVGTESLYVNKDNQLPVKILGRGVMRGGKIKIRGDVSSQFISGLLFALPLAKEDSEIDLTSAAESRNYIMITLDVLSRFGISVEHSSNPEKFKIRGNQKYSAGEYRVEGDYSSAAFILAAGALGGNVTVSNLRHDSKQGDKRIVDILKAMGAKITLGKDSVSVSKSSLCATEIDASDIPDLVPVLSVAASQAAGLTVIKNVGRLKIKESDRLAGVSGILRELGAQFAVKGNSLEIKGKADLRGCEVETLKDHRLVMASCIAGTVASGEVSVRSPAAIKKSYPGFFDDFRNLGGDVMALSSPFGNALRMRTFGESHGKRIGAIIEGVPKNIEVSQEFIQDELEKRKSISALTTPRREPDLVNIISGIENNRTTGEPIRMEIENKDTRSESYSRTRGLPRPGHADYTAREKYASVYDYRGGGFLSGRMTACFVAAGAIAKKIIGENKISAIAHTTRVGNVAVAENPSDGQIAKNRYSNLARCADPCKAKEMEAAIEEARNKGDSLGGIVECRILDLPVGLGEPLFHSIESEISRAMFSIPAVKGVEFGNGFRAAEMQGSTNNDPLAIKDGKVITLTNNAGGIQGGISNGMPVVFRVAVKPTSSIAKEQDTVDLDEMQNAKITVQGRHDPCIAIRAPPVVEAMAALVVADLMICGGFIE